MLFFAFLSPIWHDHFWEKSPQTKDGGIYTCDQGFSVTTWVNPNCRPLMTYYQCSVNVDNSCFWSSGFGGGYLCDASNPDVVQTQRTYDKNCQLWYSSGYIPFTKLQDVAYKTIPAIGDSNKAYADPTGTFKAAAQVNGKVQADYAHITTHDNGSITISLQAKEIDATLNVNIWWNNFFCYSIDWSNFLPICKSGWSKIWSGDIVNSIINTPWLTFKLEPYITSNNTLDFSTDSVDASVSSVNISLTSINLICTAAQTVAATAVWAATNVGILIDPSIIFEWLERREYLERIIQEFPLENPFSFLVDNCQIAVG